MDQSQSDGVASFGGSGRVRTQPERKRSPWGPNGTYSEEVNKQEVSFYLFFYTYISQVLEPRFNVETMALLLNIPPNKTLLRRHLATHFHLLIGSEAQRLKQDYLENPDYTVLTATAKVKASNRKRGCH